jgi:hypothetical protein
MEKEINAGYVITDRLAVGNAEFVIGHSEQAPAQFVTWKCRKGEKGYFWGHYLGDRLAAVEDLCKRALEEIECLRSLQPQRDTRENPEQQVKKRREMER